MRQIPDPLWRAWQDGLFVGGYQSNAVVTVQPDWLLYTANNVPGADPKKMPYRWFQKGSNDQVEKEIPNVKSIQIQRSLDADAASCTIQIYNQWHNENTDFIAPENAGRLGDPGHFTWSRTDPEAQARWNLQANDWEGILVPNALIRTYQGYGGKESGRTLHENLVDDVLFETGVWLVDSVRATTDGMLELQCRDMAKLLIEQQLYPPLIPQAMYPLQYSKATYSTSTTPAGGGTKPQQYTKAILEYDFDVHNFKGADGFWKVVTDIAINKATNKGYWILGNDGGIFPYGDAPGYGSMGNGGLRGPAIALAARPQGDGYWIVDDSGAVYPFGRAQSLGHLNSPGNIISATSSKSGNGYYMLQKNGTVTGFGDAAHYGDANTFGGSKMPADIDITPSGLGYYVVMEDGTVQVFGDAVFAGNATLRSYDPVPPQSWVPSKATGITAMTSGGYVILDFYGNTYGFGLAGHDVPRMNGDYNAATAATRDDTDGTPLFLTGDPMFAIESTSTGSGIVVVGGAGGVYSFGDGPFYGSLLAKFPVGSPSSASGGSDSRVTTGDTISHVGDAPMRASDGTPHYGLVGTIGGSHPPVNTNTNPHGTFGGLVAVLPSLLAQHGFVPSADSGPGVQTSGNYTDYSDIVKDFLLWSGFMIGDNTGKVYGNIESTGIASDDPLPPDLFDKKPVIDGIKTLKEIVGYLFYVDDEGGAHFESPNWWKEGNYYLDGTYTTFIPTIDERTTLIDYGVEFSDKSARSELIISSNDPDAGFTDTITTRYVPGTAANLRGQVRPAMWVNKDFINQREQELMAELVSMQMFSQQRVGSLTATANPAIGVNDQVWIYERTTGEANIHYIRSMTTNHDLDTGEWTMQLGTTQLGKPDGWLIRSDGQQGGGGTGVPVPNRLNSDAQAAFSKAVAQTNVALEIQSTYPHSFQTRVDYWAAIKDEMWWYAAYWRLVDPDGNVGRAQVANYTAAHDAALAKVHWYLSEPYSHPEVGPGS